MGLLDNLMNLNPDQTQGLLGAAAALLQAGGPSLRPTSFGQALGAGLQGFQQAQQASQDRTQQQLLAGLKLKGLQGEVDDQDQARKQRRAIEDAARNAVLSPEQQALSFGGGPTVANAARIPDMKGGFDTEGFLNQVMAINPMQALELRKSLAKTGPKFDSGITWVTGPDGKPMAVRTADDGSIKQIDGLAPRDKLELANLGGKDVAYNPYGLQDGQSFQRTATPDALLSAATQRRGQDMVDRRAQQTDPLDTTQVENVSDLIATGRMAPLSAMAMRTPFGQAVMSRVAEKNPTYRAQDFGTSSKAEKDFATGKLGGSVRSFNVSISHLDTLGQLADALDNGNTQVFNKLGNAYASQTGNPAPTNFDAAKKVVADEVVKAIVGSGGGVHDREEAARVIASANSPAQLKGVIKTYQELMVGQLGGLEQQYRTTTGREDFSKYLSPQAQSMFHPTGQSSAPAGGPPANVPAAAVSYLKMNPKLRNEFDAKFGAGAAAYYLGK